MDDLPFNIHTFVRPTTRAEYLALLDEAILLAGELDSLLNRIEAILRANACK